MPKGCQTKKGKASSVEAHAIVGLVVEGVGPKPVGGVALGGSCVELRIRRGLAARIAHPLHHDNVARGSTLTCVLISVRRRKHHRVVSFGQSLSEYLQGTFVGVIEFSGCHSWSALRFKVTITCEWRGSGSFAVKLSGFPNRSNLLTATQSHRMDSTSSAREATTDMQSTQQDTAMPLNPL